MSGEKLSTGASEIIEFIQSLSEKVTALDLSPDQIYNANETGLNCRQLKTKTFMCTGENREKVSGRKILKECLTFMVPYLSEYRDSTVLGIIITSGMLILFILIKAMIDNLALEFVCSYFVLLTNNFSLDWSSKIKLK